MEKLHYPPSERHPRKPDKKPNENYLQCILKPRVHIRHKKRLFYAFSEKKHTPFVSGIPMDINVSPTPQGKAWNQGIAPFLHFLPFKSFEFAI